MINGILTTLILLAILLLLLLMIFGFSIVLYKNLPKIIRKSIESKIVNKKLSEEQNG